MTNKTEAPEARCEMSDLQVSACGHCTGADDERPRSLYGSTPLGVWSIEDETYGD